MVKAAVAAVCDKPGQAQARVWGSIGCCAVGVPRPAGNERSASRSRSTARRRHADRRPASKTSARASRPAERYGLRPAKAPSGPVSRRAKNTRPLVDDPAEFRLGNHQARIWIVAKLAEIFAIGVVDRPCERRGAKSNGGRRWRRRCVSHLFLATAPPAARAVAWSCARSTPPASSSRLYSSATDCRTRSICENIPSRPASSARERFCVVRSRLSDYGGLVIDKKRADQPDHREVDDDAPTTMRRRASRANPAQLSPVSPAEAFPLSPLQLKQPPPIPPKRPLAALMPALVRIWTCRRALDDDTSRACNLAVAR